MKILLLNRDDAEGGAARSATRLLEGISGPAVETRLFVQRKTGDDPRIIGLPGVRGKAAGAARRLLESLFYKVSPGKVQGLFSPAMLPDNLISRVSRFGPDIIHLHWVARMMRLENLNRFRIPVVWTLHDSWPFTGGCFLPRECTRYRESCGACPVLGSSRQEDLSRSVWHRKQAAWRGLNLTLIAPSRWMAAAASSSSLFSGARIKVIHNGIDVHRYQPCDRQTSRERLNLPQDRLLVLFGAKDATQDHNKGFHLLQETLAILAGEGRGNAMELLVFGSKKPAGARDSAFRVHYLGWQDEEGIAELYAAADVFVLPSIQENLPYTVMEAMACGTPCVAFDTGGLSDLIEHKHNGYLAVPRDPVDLARGIVWVLEDYERRAELALRARQKVLQNFALTSIAEQHLYLYRELLNQP